MNALPDLETALLDRLYETQSADLKLIIGGGYGIYLKRRNVERSGVRTLLEHWPEARSTNDLDVFLRPELLIDPQRLKPLSDALRRLGYLPIKGAEKYQFGKPGPTGGSEGSLRIDLLTGPQSSFDGTAALVDDRRVRPRPSIGVHAHPVNEALTLEEGLLCIAVDGSTSAAVHHSANVYLPHPITFAMMKLFAFRDRFNDRDKDFGQYHALDLYSALALADEREWEKAIALGERHRSAPEVKEAGTIVAQHFLSPTSTGMLRLRESPYFRPEMQLDDFISAPRLLFPKRT